MAVRVIQELGIRTGCKVHQPKLVLDDFSFEDVQDVVPSLVVYQLIESDALIESCHDFSLPCLVKVHGLFVSGRRLSVVFKDMLEEHLSSLVD